MKDKSREEYLERLREQWLRAGGDAPRDAPRDAPDVDSPEEFDVWVDALIKAVILVAVVIILITVGWGIGHGIAELVNPSKTEWELLNERIEQCIASEQFSADECRQYVLGSQDTEP